MRTETPPLTPGETVVESFAPESSFWTVNGYVGAGAAVLVTVIGVGLWPVLGGAAGFAVMVFCLLCVALFFAPLAIGGIRLGATGPVLTTTRLLQPKFLRGWEVIDLAAVAGIGLRYHRGTVGYSSYNPGRWELLVWSEDGTEHSVQVVSPGGCEHSAWSTKGEPKDAAEWQHEWDLLADRLMGRAAIRIADQVRAVQGPDGLYETRHLELTAGSSSPYVDAYWTPARRLGSLS